MSYFLFLLVTATLFIRPAEILPAVSAWPIYNYLIIACLAMSLPGVSAQLSMRSLKENPITACVVGLLFAVMLSHLVYMRTWEARAIGKEFLKIIIYYLLLVANLDSQQRLQGFLRWLLALITLTTVLAILGNYHIIELPGVEFCQQQMVDSATGQTTVIPRLQSTGIFSDPNDLAMILVAGVVLALSLAENPTAGILRVLALPLVGLFGYAIYSTQSRGGLLALMAALLSLFHARWGWKRTVLLAAVALPLLLVAFKGRMTNYNDAMGQGTAQTRVQLWSEGLAAFKQHPLFGIGVDQYVEVAGQVAHNSFVHAFVELGLFGGTLFLGAFVAGLMMLYRLRSDGALAEHRELSHLLPYVTAMLVGFAGSMYSLSRNYVVPTYMMLGLMTAYVRIVGEQIESLPLQFDSWLIKRLAISSVCFLAFMYVFIRVAVHF